MSILNRGKEKTSNQLFVGAYVPDHIANYFSLLALAKDVSKSQLLRKKLDDWYQSSRAIDEETLINITVRKVIIAWRIVRASKTVTRNVLMDFDNQLSEELRNKGISEEHIEMILKKFHHEKNKRLDYKVERANDQEEFPDEETEQPDFS